MAPTVDKLYIQKKIDKKKFFLDKKATYYDKTLKIINPNFYYRSKTKT